MYVWIDGWDGYLHLPTDDLIDLLSGRPLRGLHALTSPFVEYDFFIFCKGGGKGRETIDRQSPTFVGDMMEKLKLKKTFKMKMS